MKKSNQVLSSLLFLAQILCAQTTWYVNAAATGSSNGTNWNNAFTDLKTALSQAQSGDAVWVAAGTYKPDIGYDRDATFLLKSGVKLMGGFEGTETNPSQRNIQANPVILSGNIGSLADSTDNSYTILTMNYPDADTYIDGFVFQHGYASSDTNYFYNSPVLSGGAVYIQATNGKALPVFVNCVFKDNASKGNGGAIYVNGEGTLGSMPIFKNCAFINNQAGWNGGALYLIGGYASDRGTEFDHCLFERNKASISGGGIYYVHNIGNTYINFKNCNVIGTQSCFFKLYEGFDLKIIIDSCNFIGNNSVGSSTIFRGESTSFNVPVKTVFKLLNSKVNDNIQLDNAQTISALFSFDKGDSNGTDFRDTTIIAHNVFSNNNAKAILSQNAENKIEIIENNTYANNYSSVNSGILLASTHAIDTKIFKNTIYGNTGTALYINTPSSPNAKISIENNLIYNNELVKLPTQETYNRSLINIISDISANDIHISNNTILYNRDFVKPESPGTDGRKPVLFYNNICLNNIDIKTGQLMLPINTHTDSFYFSNNLMDLPCAQLPAFSSCGPGNIIAPYALFADSAQMDFHLLPCSPAIDAGNNVVAGSTDFDGNPRIQGETVDIGPFEHPAFALSTAPEVQAACSGNSGSVALNPENGCAPYQFQWQQGANTGTGLEGLAPGDYTFTITDAKGRVIHTDVAVPGSNPPQISAQVTNSSAGAGNGAIKIEVLSGSGPYAYNWSNGAHTISLTGLSAGIYTLTLTDGIGCLYVYTYEVLQTSGVDTPLETGALVTPNPAHGYVCVAFASASEFRLYSSTGGLVLSALKPLNGVSSIDISALPAGIYYYHIGKENGKIVVNN